MRWTNATEHIASRFHQHARLIAHWRSVLPAPFLEVNYEETVADLPGTARRLVAACGLEWDPACSRLRLHWPGGADGEFRTGPQAGVFELGRRIRTIEVNFPESFRNAAAA